MLSMTKSELRRWAEGEYHYRGPNWEIAKEVLFLLDELEDLRGLKYGFS